MTREEIAVWAKVLWRRIARLSCQHDSGGWACDSCLESAIADEADALLARLRPAWEPARSCEHTTEHDFVKLLLCHACADDVKERDALRAEVDRLKAAWDRLNDQRIKIQNEVHALRADLQAFQGDYHRQAHKLATVKTDLRACAEALDESAERWETLAAVEPDASDAEIFREYAAKERAALARPGVHAR